MKVVIELEGAKYNKLLELRDKYREIRNRDILSSKALVDMHDVLYEFMEKVLNTKKQIIKD